MDPLIVHRGDNYPICYGRLWQYNVGASSAVDITGCTITLKLREKGTTTVLTTWTAAVEDSTKFKVTFPATVFDTVDAVRHEVEVTITFPGGTIQTVNWHFWTGEEDDKSKEFPIRVMEDF